MVGHLFPLNSKRAREGCSITQPKRNRSVPISPVRARPAGKRASRKKPWFLLALASMLLAAAGILALYLVLWRGTDTGQGIALLRTEDFHALAFSPDNPDVVFFGHHNGVMRSDDGGRTWQRLVERRNFDAMGLAVNPAKPSQVYLAGHLILQVSNDGGTSWQPVPHNLPDSDIHGFAMSPDDPGRLYAFVVRYGLFTSADGGSRWEKLSDRLPEDVMALAASTSGVLFAGSMERGVWKSTDSGKTWTSSSAGFGGAGVTSLAVAPTAPETIYSGTNTGLYRSDDGGRNWRQQPFPGRFPVALAISPSNPLVILTVDFVRRGEGRVYRSEDGGVTWGQAR